jgi:glycerophosphoryl diester phosphodiesterase
MAIRRTDAGTLEVLMLGTLFIWMGWAVAVYLWTEESIPLLHQTSGMAAFNTKRVQSPIRSVLVAHRGASAYAPEHTAAAYTLAIRQGADYIEQDLQLTKDGVLICLHDAELSRTTNVAEVYPERSTVRDSEGIGTPKKGWYAIDFTLAEIKRLDAGSWFNRANPFAARKNFANLEILTLEEAITLAGDHARLYIEMKCVPFYESMGKDMVGSLVSVLRSNKLGADQSFSEVEATSLPRILIQSFSKASLVKLRNTAPEYPRIQLLPMEDPGRRMETMQVTEALAREIAEYAYGVGPAKEMLRSAADISTFQRAGLKVHPFTFRGSTTATKRKPLGTPEANGRTLKRNIVNEIQRYLSLGIDGGFTDYPDLWKEAAPRQQSFTPRSR